MKNIFLTLSIFILILFTAIIKNTSKNLETEIYNIEENISILDEKYEYIFLENNYLSSPQKLKELNNNLFQDLYISINISDLKIIEEIDGQIFLKEFIFNGE
tara:strand:- start:2484 stop:2789 length:306 start_codon:yes stop_codon:yes gene_type:complete